MAGMLCARLAYAFQLLRLITLMLAGACLGHLMGGSPLAHSQFEFVQGQFSGATTGAFCGLAVELVIRQFLPVPQREIPAVRYSLRTLLIATTLVAVVLGLIVAVLR
jgi:hypothetical protein